MSFLSYAQNFEDVMLWRCFKNTECGFYIDVGAADPTDMSVTRSFYDKGWRGINVEPESEFQDRLKAYRMRDVNLQAAVAARRGSRKFYSVGGENPNGLSTFYKRLAHEHRHTGYPVQEKQVKVITLRDICEEFVGDIAVDFLKVDVEGAEVDVIAGGDFKTFRPSVVLMETTQPNTSIERKKISSVMADIDYKSVWFDGINRYFVASEKVRELGRHFEFPPNVLDDFVLIKSFGVTPASLADQNRRHQVELIEGAYAVMLMREPDAEGMAVFIQKLAESSVPTRLLLHSLLRSAEFKENFSKFSKTYNLMTG